MTQQAPRTTTYARWTSSLPWAKKGRVYKIEKIFIYEPQNFIQRLLHRKQKLQNILVKIIKTDRLVKYRNDIDYRHHWREEKNGFFKNVHSGDTV